MLRKVLGVYTAWIALWLALWRLRRDVNGWLAALNAWAFWLLLSGGGAGAFFLAPLSRLAPLLWGGLVAMLLWEGWGGIGGTGGSKGAEGSEGAEGAEGTEGTGGSEVRLLSFNMLHKPRNLTPFLEVLEGLDPDVAVFQECIVSHAAQLERQLAVRYPHRFWLPHPATNMGFGVASRLPFAVTGLWRMPPFEHYALRLTLAGPLSWDLYVVQFISPTNEVRALGPTRLLHMREAQVRRVLDQVERQARPAVVVGDWNSTEGNRVYQMAAAHLVDGWRQVRRSPGWTWPCSLNPFVDRPTPPLLRLDYLFHTGERCGAVLRVVDMQTVDLPLGSDHRPILATLHMNA